MFEHMTDRSVRLGLAAVELRQVELSPAVLEDLHRRHQLTRQVEQVDFIAWRRVGHGGLVSMIWMWSATTAGIESNGDIVIRTVIIEEWCVAKRSVAIEPEERSVELRLLLLLLGQQPRLRVEHDLSAEGA